MRLYGILIAALALLAGTALADEFSVYKWVDDEGVPHFTDRPPSNADAQATGIRSQRTDPSAVMARMEQRAATASNRGQADREASDGETDPQAEIAPSPQEIEAERREKCQWARDRAESYNTAQRLYRPLPGGEREYLTDQELDNARASADAGVTKWCN